VKGLNVRRGFVSEEISFVGAGRSGSMFAIFFKGLGYPVKFIIDCIPEKAVELSKRVPGAIAGGMELLKEQRLLIKDADKVNYNMLFSALICRRR